MSEDLILIAVLVGGFFVVSAIALICDVVKTYITGKRNDDNLPPL